MSNVERATTTGDAVVGSGEGAAEGSTEGEILGVKLGAVDGAGGKGS